MILEEKNLIKEQASLQMVISNLFLRFMAQKSLKTVISNTNEMPQSGKSEMCQKKVSLVS